MAFWCKGWGLVQELIHLLQLGGFGGWASSWEEAADCGKQSGARWDGDGGGSSSLWVGGVVLGRAGKGALLVCSGDDGI